MNNEIITQWNKIVHKNDIVYILGDFSLTNNKDRFLNLADMLKGDKYFVPGNHDRKTLNKIDGVLKVLPQLTKIHAHNTEIVLCHFPIESWENGRHGSVHLHGHSHGLGRACPNRIDVGPDNVVNLDKTKQTGKWFHIWEINELLSLIKSQNEARELEFKRQF
jgi:calcineurin-like phosphoesterase family protein